MYKKTNRSRKRLKYSRTATFGRGAKERRRQRGEEPDEEGLKTREEPKRGGGRSPKEEVEKPKEGGAKPESDYDGGGLCAGGDECDDEEEDEEGDQGVASAVALPRQGEAVFVQVGLDDDQLELVDLSAGGRRDDLPALNATAVRVVPDL